MVNVTKLTQQKRLAHVSILVCFGLERVYSYHYYTIQIKRFASEQSPFSFLSRRSSLHLYFYTYRRPYFTSIVFAIKRFVLVTPID